MAGLKGGSGRWDPAFLSRSPAFETLACAARSLDLMTWPDPVALSRAARACTPAPRSATGMPICFVGARPQDDLPYEWRIHTKGEAACRERDWHDFLNAMVWMTFPAAKAALNARHIREMTTEQPGRRGRARDAITLFDEGGAIVCSTDPHMLELIGAFQWKELFWRRRQHFLQTTRVLVFGHAMYQKLLDPFLGVSALVLLHPASHDFMRLGAREQIARADAAAARLLADPLAIRTPRDLAPLPILGVPGWFARNGEESFYDDTQYFRAGRSRSARVDRV